MTKIPAWNGCRELKMKKKNSILLLEEGFLKEMTGIKFTLNA
jgi:hypothetical protein